MTAVAPPPSGRARPPAASRYPPINAHAVATVDRPPPRTARRGRIRGDEIAAQGRLRAGRRRPRLALVADGADARVGGLVSLGVHRSAAGVAPGPQAPGSAQRPDDHDRHPARRVVLLADDLDDRPR